MPDDASELRRRVDALRVDRTSGASEILRRSLDILFAARDSGVDVREIARALCDAQPTMASLRNAAIAATSPDAQRLNQFAERVRRAPAALARFAIEHFSSTFDQPARVDGLHIVTLSYSSSVVVALKAIAAGRSLHVSCAEGRPALEGRTLTADLIAAGIRVTLFADAAIAGALRDADAVLVGADAIAPSLFLNKSGTTMLAAAASQQGVPFYVVATRDKFVSSEVASLLAIRSGDPNEIWDAPPEGVEVRNPYFESTPLDLVTAVISDTGVLGTGMVPDVCEH